MNYKNIHNKLYTLQCTLYSVHISLLPPNTPFLTDSHRYPLPHALSLHLFIVPFVYPSLSLSPSFYRSICLSISFSLSIFLSFHLSTPLFLSLSIFLSFHLSIPLFLSVSIYTSVCLLSLSPSKFLIKNIELHHSPKSLSQLVWKQF